MNPDTSTLPDDYTKLKRIIAEYEVEVRLLREQVRHLYDRLFGRKSEKSRYGENSPQLPLFDMPEPDPESEPIEPETVAITSHRRRKKGRQPLPEALPRVEIVHDIDEQEKTCHCGSPLSKIGEEVSEKLDIIPAVIQVVRHIRPKYSCKACENAAEQGKTVTIAPTPVQLIPKGIASGRLMAHILYRKFALSLPFYRQEREFSQMGLKEEILSGPLINADETTVQVLKEPGRSANSKSYMWVFRGGPPDTPALYFHYHPSRSGDVASDFLKEYQGVVQTDGYFGYDFLDSKEHITHLGCMAHARRKFVAAQKARGKNSKKSSSGPDIALKYIKDIYRIERKAKKLHLSDKELLALRQQEAKPILKAMHAWLIKKSRQVVPKSLLGKAVAYTLSQWHRLEAYLEHPFATPDNNLAENAIRPFCVGRKNWLFAGTPAGAEASAILYSLVETAKANHLDPYKYLRYLFEKLPFAKTTQEYRKLMPSRLTSEILEEVTRVSVV